MEAQAGLRDRRGVARSGLDRLVLDANRLLRGSRRLIDTKRTRYSTPVVVGLGLFRGRRALRGKAATVLSRNGCRSTERPSVPWGDRRVHTMVSCMHAAAA